MCQSGLAPNVQMSDVAGYTIDYAFWPVRQAANTGNGEAFALIPQSSAPVAYGATGIYSSCPSSSISTSLTLLLVLLPILLPSKQVPQISASRIGTTRLSRPPTPFGATLLPLFRHHDQLGLGKQYTTPASSGGGKGVVEVSLVLTFLSTDIQGMNTYGNQQTAYIMTALNPAYLLFAATTNLTLGTTTYATTSSNKITSATANFIKNNKISADTTEYISSVGCQMTVKFYTSPGGVSGLIYVPTSFNANIPPATMQGNWIVVSCCATRRCLHYHR